MKHLISARDVSKDDIMQLIWRAEEIRNTSRKKLLERLSGALVATLFYEPSTRTRLSFEAAVLRLGGQVIGAENALENSSAKKGESLQDVYRIVGSYADAIVIRHHEDDEIARAVSASPVPVINAGAGAGEHPTQALLDVYTLWREFGQIDGMHLCVMGDLKYGRTVHSLLRVLTNFQNIRVTLLHPPGLGLPDAFVHELSAGGMVLQQGEHMASVFPEVDAIYQTRLQAERLPKGEHQVDLDQFSIHPSDLTLLRTHTKILHPLPRVHEIDPNVDEDPRAAYFRQAGNGLYIRMALLDQILGGTIQ